MRSFFFRFFLSAGLVLSFWGCGGTPEDREIAFSPDGKSVGFQHGREGLFVWDAERGRAEQIYEPPAEVLAVEHAALVARRQSARIRHGEGGESPKRSGHQSQI